MPRVTHGRLLSLLAFFVAIGCQEVPFDGATVDNFDGQVVRDGKPASFSEDEEVKLLLIHKESAERFYVRVKADGSFDIGWMPIGEYLCSISRQKLNPAEPWRQGAADFKPIPGGLQIEEGKTEYEIELGADS